MIGRTSRWLAIASMVALLGCSAEPLDYGKRSLPIIGGTQVTGDVYLSTVGVVQELNPGDYHALCTGTLISPDYVLTAAHCVANCNDGTEPIEDVRPLLKIGVGQSVRTFRYIAEIAEFHVHPDYYCTGSDVRNDIAVLKLSKSIPENVVKPASMLNRALDIQSEDIDSDGGVIAVRAGYGRTRADSELSQGAKYKTEGRIYARCPREGGLSAHCGEKYTKDKGYLYFKVSESGTCLGDSGGPVLLERNGREFVIGVTSFGYDQCIIMNAAEIVSEHESFISQFVAFSPESSEEVCDNRKDDDGNGLMDCDDPACSSYLSCRHELCGNDEDDDGNGLIDCLDPACAASSACQQGSGGGGPVLKSNSSGGCSISGRREDGLTWVFVIFFAVIVGRRRIKGEM